MMRSVVPILLLLFSYCIAQTQPLQKGDAFPWDKLQSQFVAHQAHYTPDAMLVAFVPTLTDQCPYAYMMRLAFDYYFAQGLAWEGGDKKHKVQVVFVAPEHIPTTTHYYSPASELVTVADDKTALFDLCHVLAPRADTASACLFVLNKMAKITYRADHYTHQAHQLKDLEREIKATLALSPDFVPLAVTPPALYDPAPDFELSNGDLLSDLYTRRPVLLSFYPAPFSGFIPPKDHVQYTAWGTAVLRPDSLPPVVPPIACPTQLLSLDMLAERLPKSKKLPKELAAFVYPSSDPAYLFTAPQTDLDIDIVVITNATEDILRFWELEMTTNHIRYLNDPTYALAQRYGAIHPATQHTQRLTLVINTNGQITYIDPNYTLDNSHFYALRQALEAATSP